MILGESWNGGKPFCCIGEVPLPIYIGLYQLNGGTVNENHAQQIALYIRTLLRSPSSFSGRKTDLLSVSAAIAIAKETPSVWSLLSEEEKQKCSFAMEMIAYTSHLISGDGNDYRTPLTMKGNVCKYWNPNFRMQNVAPIVFVRRFFGNDLDDMFLEFDYDTVLAKVREYGWEDAEAAWTNPGISGFASAKDMLCGNPDGSEVRPAYRLANNIFGGGHGKGIKRKYAWKKLSDSWDIIADLIEFCFSGGECASKIDYDGDMNIDAYILDGTISPEEGKTGMMRELCGGDGSGFRSDMLYAYEDCRDVFYILTAGLRLGIIDKNKLKAHPSFDLICVGLKDFFYKAHHGYHSYSLGRGRDVIFDDKAIELIDYMQEELSELLGFEM